MSLDERKSEVQTKLARLREKMAAYNLEATHLTTVASTAWITAGAATYIDESTDTAASSALVTHDRAYILTTTVEEPRLLQEEHLHDLGFEVIAEPWYATGKRLSQIGDSAPVGHEGPQENRVDISGTLKELRANLLPSEVTRLRAICADAAAAMDETVRAIRPGETEHAIAARLAAATRARGASDVVNLIAGDERIYQYRHPLPTSRQVERYAMAVLCFRRSGLIASVTRLIHFGPLPDDLRARAEALARVDARIIARTQPGRTLGDVFTLARTAYADAGYPDAIDEHHQGGLAGYLTREEIATPTSTTRIAVNQAFAWNPSIRGVKSEDTIVLTAHGPEVLTAPTGWPVWNIEVDGHTIARPAILIVE
ncbi:MAG: M24 family metallopeptidase [Ktedonobacterales bacterium]